MLMNTLRLLQDVTSFAKDTGPASVSRVSRMASGLVGSEILKIAGEIRALIASGRSVCDLTVGDFSPRYFPIPTRLREALQNALERGETNYPPSAGMLDLREAVQRFYTRELGLTYPLESIFIASGSRPVIYGIYRAVCDPGDRVVSPVPSWNNNHYAHLVGAEFVALPCSAEHRFMPTRAAIIGALKGARLVTLNSPLNPTGTAIDQGALTGICEAILEENAAREKRGERALYLMYDQVYWMLCFGQTVHVTPVEVAPEMAKYTIFADGVSKAFAATGVRVGWGVGPADIIARMSALLTHVGAWAPRAEQVATVELLDDAEAIRAFHRGFHRDLQERLELLHRGFQSMKSEGLPVETIPPTGAIYLTARIYPHGRRTANGTELKTNEDVRRHILSEAGVGVVPFQAFGVEGEDGWFRLSVGAVGVHDIDEALPRLANALRALR